MTISKQEALRISRASAEQIRRAREMIEGTRTLVADSAAAIQRSRAGLRESRSVDILLAGTAPVMAKQDLPAEKEAALQIVSDQNFEAETVQVDGKHFVDCVFTNCVIAYTGFSVVFETTRFDGCRFQFQDQAATIMMFMHCFGLVAEGAPSHTYDASTPSAGGRVN